MIYAGPPEPMSPLEGGPGVGAFGGEGTPGPSAVDTGLISQNTANAIEGLIAKGLSFTKGEQGYVPTLSTLAVPSSLSHPFISAAIKGGKALISKASDVISPGQTAEGILGEVGQTAEDAVNAAFEASVPESMDVDVHFPDMSNVSIPDFAPPSALADIGMGGGFSGDSGDAAGIAAGIAAGFGGGEW